MEEHQPYFAPLDIPDPTTIPAEIWVVVDDPIREVLKCIRPTMDSQERRKDVIDYMQKLFKSRLGVEVFPYGSVPLRTYLPEGDIDLAAVSDLRWEDALPHAIFRVLHAEAQSGNAEYEIKEIQFIDAEVKLVKCNVKDFVIDISFNQLSGLCSLCFLEQVDRAVNKDHLFKRSIILIKTWCYYESRILGAYYGFLSTYALEILVLNIFQNLHASLTNPLMVLYMFLSYYSQFDWDNYCISMSGPVIRSFLPRIVVEKPLRRGGLLHGKVLRKCLDMFKVPYKASDKNGCDFTPKHLNIMDPLKLNNNLGRSVNQGNSYHIRSVFRFGAQKLGEILELPMDRIGDGIKNFFVNTLQIHQRKYVPGYPVTFGFFSSSSASPDEGIKENADLDKYISELYGRFSVDVNDMSTLDVKTDNDLEVVVDMDTIKENILCDVRKKDPNGDDRETADDVLNPLANLTGDYDSFVRSLVYSQSCHGFVSCAAKIRSSTDVAPDKGHRPFVVPPYVPSRGSPSWAQGNPNSAVMQHPPPYVNGHGNKQPCREERNTARGIGPYIPSTSCTTNGSEKNCEPALPARKLQVRIGSEEISSGSGANNMGQNPCEPSSPPLGHRQVKERKLLFGSFGPSQESTSNVVASGPDDICCKTGRVQVDEAFQLKDEEEFPPL